MAESPKGPGSLTPLTPDQVKGVADQYRKKGATFFDYKQFEKLTKDLPPSTRISDIIAFLRRPKK